MSGDETVAKPPRGGIVGNLLVLGFLSLLIGLGVRSLLLGDARFGWGMFHEQVNYQIRYRWILADGSQRQHQTGEELQGRGKKIGSFPREHQTRYGRGAVESWVQNYLKYCYQHNKPEDAVAIQAQLNVMINLKNPTEYVLTYPQPSETESDEIR